jgi:glutamate synthase (NADPH/NADH) small chain
MSEARDRIEALLNAGESDRVIEELCREAPPFEAWQFALLARAYFLRGDSRGDLYSGTFFAEQAQTAGFAEPWLADLVAQCESAPGDVKAAAWRLAYEMGGQLDRRHEGRETPYAFNALSVQAGEGTAPKDFDWVARNVPCQHACPAHTNIPEYLTAILNREYDSAYRINLESNVFPGVLGRVCARPCEDACRHGWDGLGESVAICFSKRAAADWATQEPVVLDKWFESSGKTVAVVGGGVAGLTAARELARWGHAVTVFEKHAKPGGMMNQGIPEFRLPRDVIDHEIDQIRLLGVEIVCNTSIGSDRTLDQLAEQFDAVVLAAGTLRPNLLDLPGKDLAGIRHGLEFLLEVNDTGTSRIGKSVIVIGGGFTAMDCARTAKRLGSATLSFKDGGQDLPAGSLLTAPEDYVKVWYRRTENEMLITPGELDELRHEVIDMEFLVSPVRYVGKDGHVTGVEFIRNELGEPDSSGRRRPCPVSGSEFIVPTDTVLLATGQFPDTSWIRGQYAEKLVGSDGWLIDGPTNTTECPGIFAAGDFAQGASSLISAIGHARTAAVRVDEYLMGEHRIRDRVWVQDELITGRIREMDAVPLQPGPTLEVPNRDLVAEVETGYDRDLADEETQRCYRCNFKYEIDSDKCIYCDWCIKAKPRPECILRVKKLNYDEDGRIVGWEEAEGTDDTLMVWINQYDCIRCGACVQACPVDAISVQRADLETAPACGQCASV